MLDMIFAICWFPMVLGGGFTALFFSIQSVSHMKENRCMAGLSSAIFELLAASISISAWMWALASSGKPTFWFGLSYNLLMSLICTGMIAVGAICTAINAWGLAKKRELTDVAQG